MAVSFLICGGFLVFKSMTNLLQNGGLVVIHRINEIKVKQVEISKGSEMPLLRKGISYSIHGNCLTVH